MEFNEGQQNLRKTSFQGYRQCANQAKRTDYGNGEQPQTGSEFVCSDGRPIAI